MKSLGRLTATLMILTFIQEAYAEKNNGLDGPQIPSQLQTSEVDKRKPVRNRRELERRRQENERRRRREEQQRQREAEERRQRREDERRQREIEERQQRRETERQRREEEQRRWEEQQRQEEEQRRWEEQQRQEEERRRREEEQRRPPEIEERRQREEEQRRPPEMEERRRPTHRGHRPHREIRYHTHRWHTPRHYHITIPLRYIYWNTWVRWYDEGYSYSDGFYWYAGYPYFIHNGYRHRYSHIDMCNYELVDGHTNTTYQSYPRYICSTGYDLCARLRDNLNYNEEDYRYFCSERLYNRF